jgi:hypothetical protein
VLVPGEEHPIDGPAGLLQARPRLRSRHDHDISGGYADDQLARDRTLETVPERVGEQHAGLEPVEGEHQRGRLPVDAHAIQH